MCCAIVPPIPIAADRPLHKTPKVTYTLIAVEAAVHLAMRIVSGLENLEILPEDSVAFVYGLFGYTPAKVLPWSFFTYAFLHANLFHLLGNLLSLWLFGVFIEERLGTVRYILLLLAAAPLAALGHEAWLWTKPFPGLDETPLIGASGYILGILGLFLVLFPTVNYRCIWILWFVFYIHIGRLVLPALAYIPLFVLWNDIYALLRLDPEATDVAHGAHLGGAALGLAVGLVLRFAPKSQRAIDRQLAQEKAEKDRLAALAYENFHEALNRGTADAATAILREGERAGRPLPLTLRDRVRLAETLETEGEAFLAGQTYRNLLAGDLLNREQRLEIGLRLARIILFHERNLEAAKEILRAMLREHHSDPRLPEIRELVDKVQEFERNLYKRPR